MSDQQLQHVSWRLDIPIASRSVLRGSNSDAIAPAAPQFVLAFHTRPSTAGLSITTDGANTPATSGDSSASSASTWVSCDVETAVNIAVSLEEAIASLHAPQHRRIRKLVK